MKKIKIKFSNELFKLKNFFVDKFKKLKKFIESKIINKNGFFNFPLHQLKIKTDDVTDSSLLYLEHHYSPPEKFKTCLIPSFNLSS